MDDLKDLCYGMPGLVLRQSVQPLDHRLHFLLAKKLPNNFSFSFKSQVINTLTGGGLTEFSPLHLFCRRCEYVEQLHEYLDDDLIHAFCGSDLGIDLEAIEKVAN